MPREIMRRRWTPDGVRRSAWLFGCLTLAMWMSLRGHLDMQQAWTGAFQTARKRLRRMTAPGSQTNKTDAMHLHSKNRRGGADRNRLPGTGVEGQARYS
jgi:hypothetical protein